MMKKAPFVCMLAVAGVARALGADPSAPVVSIPPPPVVVPGTGPCLPVPIAPPGAVMPIPLQPLPMIPGSISPTPITPTPITPTPITPTPITPTPIPSVSTPELSGAPVVPNTPETFNSGASAATGGGEGGSGGLQSAAPNMIGDLLGVGRSLAFVLNRDAGPVFIENTGATTLVNPKVAENNSPIPRDRVGFRYNYFNRAVSVVGLADELVNAPQRSLEGLSRPTRIKDYDYHLYTFNLEKTFLDGLASAEVRVPFRTSLSSKINYSVGDVRGVRPFLDSTQPVGRPLFYNPAFTGDARFRTAGPFAMDAYDVTPTPENTLGNSRTELDNVSMILKAILLRENNLVITGGVSVTAPTAPDAHVTVTDYVGQPRFNEVDAQRIREFKVSNDTWGLAPFVAALYQSSDTRFFAQGFVQLDVPVGNNRIEYNNTTTSLNPFIPLVPRAGEIAPPFTATNEVREQMLLHVDLGLGYWLYRNPEATWFKGFAPSVELHYTTALEDADLATLPNDPYTISIPTGRRTTNNQGVSIPVVTDIAAAPSTVGNRRNRIDILNATFGGTFLLGERAMLATAVALPLRGGDNRTFDWEAQLQFNWYFGSRAAGTPLIPNLFR